MKRQVIDCDICGEENIAKYKTLATIERHDEEGVSNVH